MILNLRKLLEGFCFICIRAPKYILQFTQLFLSVTTLSNLTFMKNIKSLYGEYNVSLCLNVYQSGFIIFTWTYKTSSFTRCLKQHLHWCKWISIWKSQFTQISIFDSNACSYLSLVCSEVSGSLIIVSAEMSGPGHVQPNTVWWCDQSRGSSYGHRRLPTNTSWQQSEQHQPHNTQYCRLL